MSIRKFLFVGVIGMLVGNNLEPYVSSPAAEPASGQASNTAAPQAEAANQPDDVARASALLAEFRAAKTEEDEWSSLVHPKHPADTRRSQIEVGRDLTKLNRTAVPLLIKALDDPDPKVSAVAALALGRIGDARAVEPMLKVLHSFLPLPKSTAEPSPPPPGQLRAQACVCALGQLREPRAIAPIVALQQMSDEPSKLVEELGFQDHSWEYMCGVMYIVCGDAIEQIGVAGVPELVKLLSNADGETRASAAEHLAFFGVRDRKFRANMFMTGRGHDEDESARARDKREALSRAVSDRVATLAGGKLIEIMRDKEWDVRRSASQAVGNLRMASAIGPLIERLQDEEPYVRVDAIDSLGQIGDPAALDALALLLKNPGSDQSYYAELSVAMIGGPRAFALLKAGLENAQPERRRAAVHGLSELRTSEAIDLIITALKDTDRNVRCDAAIDLRNLSRAEMARAVEPLIAATRDKDNDVRLSALTSLAETADPRVADTAMAALKDSDYQMRANALAVLGLIKDAKSVGAVKAMLKDPNAYVRATAVSALAELNPPDLAECLRPMLDDKDNDVRAKAADAMSKLAKPAPGQNKDH